MDTPLKPRAIRAVAIGVALMSLFAFFFVYPGHDPEPNGLPVATARPVDLPGFDTRIVRDEGQARQMILDRDVYAAILEDKTLIASAASYTVAQVFRERAQGGAVEEVRALDADDPRGTSIGLLTLPPGSYLILSLIAALTLLAANLPSGGLVRIMGPPAVGLAFVLFLMLGNPSSGASSAPELLPSLWAEGGQFLQAGAGATAIRNVAYFDGVAVAVPLIVLLAWAAIGVALHVIAERRQPSVN